MAIPCVMVTGEKQVYHQSSCFHGCFASLEGNSICFTQIWNGKVAALASAQVSSCGGDLVGASYYFPGTTLFHGILLGCIYSCLGLTRE